VGQEGQGEPPVTSNDIRHLQVNVHAVVHRGGKGGLVRKKSKEVFQWGGGGGGGQHLQPLPSASRRCCQCC